MKKSGLIECCCQLRSRERLSGKLRDQKDAFGHENSYLTFEISDFLIEREQCSGKGLSKSEGVAFDNKQVQLILNDEDRKSLNHLKNFKFVTEAGEEVPLSSFATFQISKGPRFINRKNGKNRLRVRVYTTKDDVKELYQEIDRAMEGFTLPRGYEWNKGERYSTYARESEAMTFAILMAVTFVFLLMGILFESIILPFAVIFSIPFAFLGVYWGLWATDTIMGFMSKVGVIVLIGVVVNNAIVLVDMINRLRAEGMNRGDAILQRTRVALVPPWRIGEVLK